MKIEVAWYLFDFFESINSYHKYFYMVYFSNSKMMEVMKLEMINLQRDYTVYSWSTIKILLECVFDTRPP